MTTLTITFSSFRNEESCILPRKERNILLFYTLTDIVLNPVVVARILGLQEQEILNISDDIMILVDMGIEIIVRVFELSTLVEAHTAVTFEEID